MTGRTNPPRDYYEGCEWRPAAEDSDWEVAADAEGLRCSQPRCGRPAVILLWRTRAARYGYRNGKPPIRRRWGCCVYHTYGRWVEDGKVWYWKLVEAAP